MCMCVGFRFNLKTVRHSGRIVTNLELRGKKIHNLIYLFIDNPAVVSRSSVFVFMRVSGAWSSSRA